MRITTILALIIAVMIVRFYLGNLRVLFVIDWKRYVPKTRSGRLDRDRLHVMIAQLTHRGPAIMEFIVTGAGSTPPPAPAGLTAIVR